MKTDADIAVFVDSFFPPDYLGYALEIGACDGIYLSNTLHMEKRGWNVLCIEPNPIYYADLVDNRKICLPYACSDEHAEDMELEIHDRAGVPKFGWEAGEPISVLKGTLTERYVEEFCPDILPANYHRVKVRTLDHCLEEVGFPKLDYLSLDVDGIEAKVLKGLDTKRWGTQIIVVENPFRDQEISDLLESRGFEMLDRVHINEVWRLV